MDDKPTDQLGLKGRMTSHGAASDLRARGRLRYCRAVRRRDAEARGRRQRQLSRGHDAGP